MKLNKISMILLAFVFSFSACSNDDDVTPNKPKKEDPNDTTDNTKPVEISGKILGTWYLDEMEETSGKNFLNGSIASTFNTEMRDVFGQITFKKDGKFSQTTEYNFTRFTLEKGVVIEQDGTVNETDDNGQYTYKEGETTFKMKGSKAGSVWVINQIKTITDTKLVFVAKLETTFPPQDGVTAKITSDMEFVYSK
jgi:hypothetical protein